MAESVATERMDEFEQARDQFLGQISAGERAQFTKIESANDFLKGIKDLEKFAKNRGKWRKIFEAVKSCSEKIEPYFEIISILVSSHPEYAAIVWGAFRLVLQVSHLVVVVRYPVDILVASLQFFHLL